MSPRQVGKTRVRVDFPRTAHNAVHRNQSGYAMEVEALIKTALREAGYGPDAIGSALPRIMRILQAEDVRIEMGRVLSRKEREFVRPQLELGLNVSEVIAGLKA
jgi:hypothetical protein